MCGICGVFLKDRGGHVPHHVIDIMTEKMVHRGPDDQGAYFTSGGALGHRRLTIIDPDGGSQPMQTSDGAGILVTNSEIYNYPELRSQYLSKRLPSGVGDTEVLLHLLESMGDKAVPLLNGLFAFGYWNLRDNTLLLARDPVGQKPLFFYHGSEHFVFASDLSSLALSGVVPIELNDKALARYLLHESYPQPYTPLTGVKKLPPGCFLQLDLLRWESNTACYWDNPVTNELTEEKTSDLIDRFAETLTTSVNRHLRADVDIGIFLSGGLDSPSLVKATCNIRDPKTIQTFTVRHELDSFNEADHAREIAEYYGTDHHEQTVTGNSFLSDIELTLPKMDEPIADPGFLAIYQAVKFSREHVKVILSGNGSDEHLAGYSPFGALKAYQIARHLVPKPCVPILKHLASFLPATHGYMAASFKFQRFLRAVDRPPAEMLMQWIGSFNYEEISSAMKESKASGLLSAGTSEDAFDLYDDLYQEYNAVQHKDYVTQLLSLFQRFYLPNSICNHSDKSSMLLSQELRSPYLDVDMMRFANALPLAMKYHGGKTKVILRRYLETGAPRSVSSRRKRGFTVPISAWLTTALKPWASDVLDPTQLHNDGLFNPTHIREMWDDHQAGKTNNGKPLWTILVFQTWLHSVYAEVRAKRATW